MSAESEVDVPDGVGATQVADALEGQGVIRGGITSRTPGLKVFGPAYTLRIRSDDNLGLHKAIYAARPGEVLVASVEGAPEWGLWGELMTAAASRAGLAGLVTDGGVRDVDALADFGFPVFSAGVDIRSTSKRHGGEQNSAIEIGGVTVRPGDYVLGDDDGLIVIPAGELNDCLSRAKDIAGREAHLLREIENGASLYELLGLGDPDNHGGDAR